VFGYNHYKNDYKNEGDSHESIVSDIAKTVSNNMTLAHADSIDAGWYRIVGLLGRRRADQVVS
jgi:hypothetical protein